jgi:hypothetical protein
VARRGQVIEVRRGGQPEVEKPSVLFALAANVFV